MLKNISNNKLGNILFYLASKIERLSLTKALKLLYLIDETAVKRTGVPITWADYKVWKYGPVPVDIYNEIKYGNSGLKSDSLLRKFIKVERSFNDDRLQEEVYLFPRQEYKFDDSGFSDFEINLIDEIIRKYGYKTANELIEILHQEGTLWDKVVKEKKLERSFEIRNNKSNYSIVFDELIKDDEVKLMAMKSALESLELQSQLNS